MFKYILTFIFGGVTVFLLIARSALRSQDFLDYVVDKGVTKFDEWLYDGELPSYRSRSTNPNEMTTRYRKFEPPLDVPRGAVLIQQSPPRTGKTVRANAWMAKDPDYRRVVDGDRKEAERLANNGYSVVLNLLPGM